MFNFHKTPAAGEALGQDPDLFSHHYQEARNKDHFTLWL